MAGADQGVPVVHDPRADLLDRSNSSDSPAAVTESLRAWLYGFLEATGGRQPAVWGLHNYIDANRGRTTVTRAVLSLIKGRIWFTGAGGLVSRAQRLEVQDPQGLAHAAATTDSILTGSTRQPPCRPHVPLPLD